MLNMFLIRGVFAQWHAVLHVLPPTPSSYLFSYILLLHDCSPTSVLAKTVSVQLSSASRE